MTQEEAVDLIQKLLRAPNEEELTRLVSLYLPAVDGTFFATAEMAAQDLTRAGKSGAARALRALTERMAALKTLI